MILDELTIKYFAEINKILWELNLDFKKQGFTGVGYAFSLFKIAEDMVKTNHTEENQEKKC